MERTRFHSNFFLYAKMIFLLVIFIMVTISGQWDEIQLCIYFLLSALFFSCAVMTELSEKKKAVGGILELLILVIMYQIGFSQAIYFGPMVLLDVIILLKLPVWLCLTICLIPIILIRWFAGTDVLILCLESVFSGILYYQEHAIIRAYRDSIEKNNEQESQLKQDMESARVRHENQMKQSRLAFENQMLQEKADISQALHDKLGHSINGSLYQLEACKVILSEKPEEGKKILQAVIDALRTSMDEIRLILRREKPDKRQMALFQLQALCEECRKKYSIDAALTITGEKETVDESIWEMILDNTYEAVSNALKYAECTKLTIQIVILNEVVCCTVKDNGVGCGKLKEGMGIEGMKRRVRSVNGYLNIESNDGFQISMILPLNRGQADGTD